MVFVMTNTRAFGLWLRLALKEELSLAIFFLSPLLDAGGSDTLSK